MVTLFSLINVLSSRSCDSTFGLGGCKENELDWLSSVDDPGGSRDELKLDCKFQCPEPNVVEDISENHDFSKGYSINDSSMNSEPIGYKCCSWSSEESDSFMSFVSDPAIADSKDEVTPQELVSIRVSFHLMLLLKHFVVVTWAHNSPH